MINKEAQLGQNVKLWYPELSNIGHCLIGDNTIIHSHVWIGDGVVIGKNVRIQAFTFIPDGVVIEDDVFIGPHVTFTNDKNPPSDKEEWQDTLVSQGAVIGANSVILPGINIGKGAIVGAGSVVTRSVYDNTVVIGNPARLYKK